MWLGVINFGTGNPRSEFSGLIDVESGKVKVNYRFEIVDEFNRRRSNGRSRLQYLRINRSKPVLLGDFDWRRIDIHDSAGASVMDHKRLSFEIISASS